MRVLICGGRNFDDSALFSETMTELHAEHKFEMVIHGGAPGADRMADLWARMYGVERMTFPADWNRHGRAAGPIRNQQMLDEGKPDLVIAFPGGRGTRDMMKRAFSAGVKVCPISSGANP